jgi:cytoskeletal protein CcmA (bactofilin family)
MNDLVKQPSVPANVVLAVLLAALAVMLQPVAPAHALDRRSGESIVVRADEVVPDNLAVAGRLVRIDGRVAGDVYAFAQNITVTGVIEGDLIVAAQQAIVDGQILGSVRAAGATVQVNGAVGRNVTGAAQLLGLGPGGRVGGSWIGGGETLSLAGDIGGSLVGAGETVLLQGQVRRDAELALNRITFGPNARIGGDLVYHAEDALAIPSGVVAGQVRFQPAVAPERMVERQRNDVSRFFGALGSFLGLTWLAGSAVVGLIFLRGFPRFTARFLAALEREPVSSFVVGVAALVATLPIAVLIGITVVGLPASLLLVAGYFAGIYGGWLLLAVAVGSILVGWVRPGRPRHLAWAFLLGLLVLHLTTHIPFAGSLVAFIAAALGLGGLLVALYRAWRREEPPPLRLEVA